jgi:ankyrin repeat protein
MLLEAGSAPNVSARGDGGTPLVMALFWGNREAADVLATRGLVPNNLRVAAGVGDSERVRSLFGALGRLSKAAGGHRGFYRPHSGFPFWTPSDDAQEILDESLVYACKSARLEVLPLLVERGARISSDVYRGTPLIWAAWRNRTDVLHWLLDHGAEVNQRATFGGPGHGAGVTALHLAAQCGHIEAVRILIERGADRSIKDDLHNGTPRSWAEHFGKQAVADHLRETS